MTYDEYYNMIIVTFKNSIKTQDVKLYNKILNTLLKWYKDNYESDLIDYFKEKNESSIVNISKEIQEICKLNDYEKMQNTYQCEQLDELNKVSDEIFELVKKMKNDTNVDFSESDYKNIVNKFKQMEINFPKIIFSKFEFIRSECFLDLNYLINRGKVQSYSLRTYDYLKNADSI